MNLARSSHAANFRSPSAGARARPKAFASAAHVAMNGTTSRQRLSPAKPAAATLSESGTIMRRNNSLPAGSFASAMNLEQQLTSQTPKRVSLKPSMLDTLHKERVDVINRDLKAEHKRHPVTKRSIWLRVLSMAGEHVFDDVLPQSCHQQAAHHVICECLLDSQLLKPGMEKKCKFVCDCQVVQHRDITTLEELAETAGRADASTDSVLVELTLAKLTKPTKPKLNADEQKAVDEALLEAVNDLDEMRVDELLAAGADSQIEHPYPYCSFQRMLPLHLAVKRAFHDTSMCIPANGRAVILSLLEDGADPAVVHRFEPLTGDDQVGTAFELALPQILHDTMLLCAFLEKGANPNTHSNRRDKDMYEHVLHMAVAMQQPKSAQALLDAGVHVDSIRDEVTRPVMAERARHCIWADTALAGYTMHERYAYDQLLERDRVHRRRAAGTVEAHLRAEKATMTALHVACSAGDLSMSAWLLARGANPNAVIRTQVASKKGFVVVEETPLQLALENGPKATPLVALLVIVGADISHRAGIEAKTPEALCNGSPSLLGALQARWANQAVQALFPTDILPNVHAALRCVEKREEGKPA